MDCQKLRRYLALYLDSELSPEITFEISSHLDDCSGCRRMAELEARLEQRLKGKLRHPEPGDGDTWAQAVNGAMKQTSQRTQPRRRLTIAFAAVAATAGVFAVLFGGSHEHDELDLAEATAAAHVEYVSGAQTGFDVSGEAIPINEYFQQQLAAEFCVHMNSGEDRKVLGGIIGELSGIRTAHLVFSLSSSPVSLFWFPKSALTAFPETVARLQTEKMTLHCHVDAYEFFVNRAGSGVLVGIGSIPADSLEAFVNAASGSDCAEGRNGP